MSSIVRFASHLQRRTRETTEIVSGSSSFGARLCPTNRSDTSSELSGS